MTQENLKDKALEVLGVCLDTLNSKKSLDGASVGDLAALVGALMDGLLRMAELDSRKR